ncbi:MAG: c-type cytochrome [Caulobacteraceae bacterium]
MLRRLLFAGAGAAVLGLAGFWLLTEPATVHTAALGPHTPDLANGRTMFLAGDCAACHATPLQKNPDRLGGGLGLVSKFGTFYAPNISADVKDGVGGWTEAQFVTAVTKGTSPEGEHFYPIFPYASFQRMKTEDVRDLFAYIKTLPAVAGRAPRNEVPFPFNIRRGVGLWKLLYLDGKTYRTDGSKSAQWNRGAYLVNGPEPCAECHSPRNALGAIAAKKRFSGNPIGFAKGGFPNITTLEWSRDDWERLLETGVTAKGDPVGRVGGPMVEVVRSTAQLSPEDRAAMAEYLVSLRPVAIVAPAPAPRPG